MSALAIVAIVLGALALRFLLMPWRMLRRARRFGRLGFGMPRHFMRRRTWRHLQFAALAVAGVLAVQEWMRRREAQGGGR